MSVQVTLEPDSSRLDSALQKISVKMAGIAQEVNKIGSSVNSINGKGIQTDSSVAQLKQLNSQFNNLEKSLTKTFSNTVRSVQNLIVTIGALAGGGALGKGLVAAADKLTNVENRIALVTGRTKELYRAQEALKRISNETYGSMDTSLETFNRLGVALKDAGKGTDDILKATEAINRAVAVSGSTADSAAAAIYQLGQGLGANALRGEELNSVLEQTPRLARAIADGLGTNIAGLRKMAQAGELGSEAVFGAIISQSEQLREEFELLNPTVEQSKVALKNSLTPFMAELDAALGLSKTMGRSFFAWAKWLDDRGPDFALTIYEWRVSLKKFVSDAKIIGGGLANVFSAIFERAWAAVPTAWLPFLTMIQQADIWISSKILGGLQFVTNTIAKIRSDLYGLVGSDLSGAFYDLFNSTSVVEFRQALDRLAEAIREYGLNWFNWGNHIEKTIRRVRVWLIKLGQDVHLLDQRLINVHYVSIERVGKAARAASVFFKEFVISLMTSELAVKALILIETVLRYIGNYLKILKGESNDFWGDFFAFTPDLKGSFAIKTYISGIRKALEPLENMFARVGAIAQSGLNRALAPVAYFYNRVSFYFYDLWDKVVGHSYWPDLVDGVILYAEKFGVVERRVKTFTERISDSFRKLGDSIKKSSFYKQIKSAYEWIADTAQTELAVVSAKYFDKKVLGGKGAAIDKLGNFAWIVSLGDVILNKLKAVLMDAGAARELGEIFGRILGDAIYTLIQNLPRILQAFSEVAKGFATGFVSEFGILGKVLATIGSRLPVVAQGFTLLGTAMLGMMMPSKITGPLMRPIQAFLGSDFKAQTKGKDKDGLITQLLLGSSGRKGLAAVIAAGTALTSMGVIFKDYSKLSTIFGGTGMLSFILFGGKGSLMVGLKAIDSIRNALMEISPSRLGMNEFGKGQTGQGMLPSESIFNRVFGAGATTGDPLTDGIMKSLEKINFKGFTKKIKDELNGIALWLAMESPNIGKAFASSLEFIMPAVTRITDFVKANAGPLGLAGKLFFGAAGAALILNSLSGVAMAAGDEVDGLLTKYAFLDAAGGILGFLMLGGATNFRGMGTKMKKMMDSLKKDIQGRVFASSMAGEMGGSFLASLVGGITKGAGKLASLGGFFTRIFSGIILTPLKMVFSKIGLFVAGSVAAIATVWITFWGKGETYAERWKNAWSSVKGVFTGLTKEGEKVKKQLQDLAYSGKVGDIEIDLVSKLNDINFNVLSEKEVSRLERELKASNKVFEASQSTFEEQGMLTQNAINGTTEAVNRVERAIDKLSAKGEVSFGEQLMGSLTKGFDIEKLITQDPKSGSHDERINNELQAWQKRLEISSSNEDFAWRGLELRNILRAIDPNKLQDAGINPQLLTSLNDLQPLLAQLVNGIDFIGLDRKEQVDLAASVDVDMIKGLYRWQNQGNVSVDESFKSGLKAGTDIGDSNIDSLTTLTKGVNESVNQYLDRMGRWVETLSDRHKDLAQFQLDQVSKYYREGDISLKKASQIADVYGNALLEGQRVANIKAQAEENLARAKEELPRWTQRNFEEEIDLGRASELQLGYINGVMEQGFQQLETARRAMLEAGIKNLADQGKINLQNLEALKQADPARYKQLVDDLFAQNPDMFPTETFLNLSTKVHDAIAKAIAQVNSENNLQVFKPDYENFEEQKQFIKDMFSDIASIVPEFGEIEFDFQTEKIANEAEVAMRAIKANWEQLQKDIAAGADVNSTAIRDRMVALGTSLAEFAEKYGTTMGMIQSGLSQLETPANVGELIKGDQTLIAKGLAIVKTLLAVKFAMAALSGIGSFDVSGVVNLDLQSQVEQGVKDLGNVPGWSAPKGGGGGGSQKTWLEQFKENVSSMGFSVEDAFLYGLRGDSFNRLRALSTDYAKAQEAINKSSEKDFELRKKQLDIMRKIKVEALGTLRDGTVGGMQNFLESSGVDIDGDMAAKLNEVTSAWVAATATRIFELREEIKTLKEGSAEARKRAGELSFLEAKLNSVFGAMENMKSTFSDSLTSLLTFDSSFKEFIHSILDTFTTEIISQFSQGFTEMLWQAFDLDSLLANAFGGVFDLGGSMGGKLGTMRNPMWTRSADGGILGGEGEGKEGWFSKIFGKKDKKDGEQGEGGGMFSWIGNLFKGFTDIFSNLFSGLFDGLKGLFGGGGGGGGGFGGIFSFLGGLFGFAEGGPVFGPGTGTSDSIPAWLSNGEFVVNAAATRQWMPFLQAINSDRGRAVKLAKGGLVGTANPSVLEELKPNSGKTQTQQFNINITGDISTQTKKEVLKLVPQLAQGINGYNRQRTQ